ISTRIRLYLVNSLQRILFTKKIAIDQKEVPILNNEVTEQTVELSESAVRRPSERYEQLQFDLDFDDEYEIIKSRSISARSKRFYHFE
ncbi:MAG: hypothetical protein WBL80_00645, partial [Erysipelotrichaceae bacterium]